MAKALALSRRGLFYLAKKIINKSIDNVCFCRYISGKEENTMEKIDQVRVLIELSNVMAQLARDMKTFTDEIAKEVKHDKEKA